MTKECAIPYEKKLYGTYMSKLYVKYRGHIIVKYMSHICILNVNEVEDIYTVVYVLRRRLPKMATMVNALR